MGGDGDQIRPQGPGGEGDFQEALHRIGVKQGIGAELMGQLCHLADGHHGTYLVVHHHNGHQNGIRPQGCFQILYRDPALIVRLKIGHFKALAFQLLHAVENGVVLNGGGDDMAAPLAVALGGAENSPVVCFRAAGGEKHPVGLCTHGSGHGMPCGFQLPRGINTKVVQCAGVAPGLGHSLHHSLHRLATGTGGGGIVQIDHNVTFLHKIVQKFGW